MHRNRLDRNAFFWQIQDGRLPTPKAAQTLGINITSVNAETGFITVEFDAKEEFTNPSGKIQGGFLAAMLDDTMGPALAATLNEGEFGPTLDCMYSFSNPPCRENCWALATLCNAAGQFVFLQRNCGSEATSRPRQPPPRSSARFEAVISGHSLENTRRWTAVALFATIDA